MANHALWRGVSTTLPRSKKWRRTNDEGRALWIGLLLASDTYGIMEADTDQLTLTAVVGWDEAKAARALAHLVAVGLVEVYDAEGRRWLALVDYDEHAPAELLRKRGKARNPAPHLGIPVVLDHEGRTTTPPEVEEEVEEEEEKRERFGTDVPAPVAAAAATPVVSKPEPPKLPPMVEAVYEHWRTRQKDTGGLVARKLTPDRRAKIVARLRDGYTVQQLCDSIDGFLADPWHLGQNNRQTRYTDLTTLFKNAAKVDAGIELGKRTRATTASTDDARNKYVRPVTQ